MKTNAGVKQPQIKHIIFDFDGTIANTFDIALEIINKNPQRFGIDGIDPTEIPRLKSMSMKYLLQEFNIHIFQIPKFLKMLKKDLAKEIDKVQVFEGMIDVLKQLSTRYTLGIISSNSKSNIKKVLKNNNLDMFEYVIGEPAIFGKSTRIKNILKKQKLQNSEVIYIGDEVRDIQAANKVGIDIISCTWGYNNEDIIVKHEPNYLVHTPSEILNIL